MNMNINSLLMTDSDFILGGFTVEGTGGQMDKMGTHLTILVQYPKVRTTGQVLLVKL